MLKRLLHSTHSLLGTVVSLLFLMWFITGLVLVYHSFPDVNKDKRNHNREILKADNYPAISQVINTAQSDKAKLQQLNQYQDQTVFTLTSSKGVEHISATLQPISESITLDKLQRIAAKWSKAPIAKIDTLQKRDIWVMYTKYLKELPLYKIHFDDAQNHHLYLSSKTGEVQQFTTRSERVWAYLGSIPHKLYIPALREHTNVWIATLTILATLCFIATLSGIVLGLRALIKRYKRKGKLESPYAKIDYKWHHILGLVFGLFLLTWSISGMMALQKTPQWLVKTHNTQNIAKKIKGTPISPIDFKLDYREIISSYPNIKQLKWNYFQDTPYYEIVVDDIELYIDASNQTIEKLYLSQSTIEQAIRSIHGPEAKFSIELINNYEEYYLPWKRELPLPVYKVKVESPDNDSFYISPETGYFKHMNDNRIARKWLFNAFHYAHIKWLMDRPVLWTIIVWGLSLGCIAVSGTGVILSVRYLKRKINNKKNKKRCHQEK